jgi:hypothetical protein
MSFGGIGPLLQYGMGGRTSHVTTAVWDTDSKGNRELYIVESRDGTDWPNDGVQRNTYDLWISMVEKEETSVVYLPLKKELSEKYDEAKAWARFKELQGNKYGYPNVITTWIGIFFPKNKSDTEYDNYPPLLDFNFAYSVFMILQGMKYSFPQRIFAEPLNMRLGTKDLDMKQIPIEAKKQGKTLRQLMAMPEQDKWVYSDGQSRVCSSLAIDMYMHAGLFGDLNIQATEFTPRDVYQLGFFKGAEDLPAECKANDPELSYCQIMGDTLIDLAGFNSVKPYSQMNEKCGGEPPLYVRKEGC